MDIRTERVSPPTAYARKNADGFWYVAVTWGNGRKEWLGPYKTEAVAQELIKTQLAAWHEGQKLFLKARGNIAPPLNYYEGPPLNRGTDRVNAQRGKRPLPGSLSITRNRGGWRVGHKEAARVRCRGVSGHAP